MLLQDAGGDGDGMFWLESLLLLLPFIELKNAAKYCENNGLSLKVLVIGSDNEGEGEDI